MTDQATLDDIRERYQKALDAKPSKGDYTPAGIDAIIDSVCDIPTLLAAGDKLADRVVEAESEVFRLTRWQTEATEVMRGLQDLGKALSLPLGERITGSAAVVAAAALRDRIAALNVALQDEREAHGAAIARAEAAEQAVRRVRTMANGWLRLSLQAIDPDVREWTGAAGRSVLEALDGGE